MYNTILKTMEKIKCIEIIMKIYPGKHNSLHEEVDDEIINELTNDIEYSIEEIIGMPIDNIEINIERE